MSGRMLPAIVLVGVVLAGCGPQAEPTTADTSPSAAASPSPATSPSAAVPPSAAATTSAPAVPPTGSGTEAAAWTTFTTADGQLAFDLPAVWSVVDPAGELPEGGGAFAEVANEEGRPMAALRSNMATGSTCTEKYPYTVLDSQELPALARSGGVPRFIYETRGTAAEPGPANTPAAAYGITSGPPADGGSACPIFQFFTWPPTAAMFGAFYNPANNLTPGAESLPYLEQARKYMDTAEYRSIKRMITSLRPAR